MMGAPKKGYRRHVYVCPYVYPGKDARVDKALAWFDAQAPGKRTRMCWELIVAAVNGELGLASTVTINDDGMEQAQKALEGLLKNMVMDE
jgi:hypothetical protein